MSNNKRYFLYVRKSSEGDEQQAQSIPDQLAVMKRFAAERGLTIVEVLEEKKSAKEPYCRPIFTGMVERIKAGEADAILCWHVNRLFRNEVDYATVSYLLRKGVIQTIHTHTREYLPTDNVLLLAVEAGISTNYSVELSQNVLRGLHEKAHRGVYPTRPLPGYRSVPFVVGIKTQHAIEIDPERFSMIRRAWDKMLTGAYTVPEVLEMLNEWGFRTPKTPRSGDKPMSRSSFYRLFKNPFYYGPFWYGGAFHQGTHQPMVSKVEFDRVQELLNRNGPTRPHRLEFAFTGLIQCGVCGCQITAERKVKPSGATYTYYHCTGRRGCKGGSVSERHLEHCIWSLLRKWHFPLEVAELGLTLLKQEQMRTHPDMAVFGQRRETIAAARQKATRLLEMRENDEISSQDFTTRRNHYLTQVTRLEEEANADTQRFETNRKAIASAFRFLSTDPDELTTASVTTKREIAALLADSYVLTRGKLYIRPKSLLAKIGALEPPKPPDLQVGGGTGILFSSAQRRWWNHIQTLLTGSETWSMGEPSNPSSASLLQL